jgi:hypothetical protein
MGRSVDRGTNRANLVVETEWDKRVFLYTHWDGERVPEVVQKTLDNKLRLDDPLYLTRMLFCKLCPVKEWDSEYGYGISTTFGDNNHDVLLVRPGNLSVELHKFDYKKHDVVGNWKEPMFTWTYTEYCRIEDISWKTLQGWVYLKKGVATLYAIVGEQDES